MCILSRAKRYEGRSRRRGIWPSAPSSLLTLAAALLLTTPARAQFTPQDWPPPPVGGIPITLAEHGDPMLALPFALSLAGLVVYDIATAQSSAEAVNRRAGAVVKSPGMAMTASIAGTTAPILAGWALGMNGSGEAAAVMIAAGVVLGPSLGHWYAGRTGRGAATAALRAGLGLVAGLAALAAS